MNNLDKRNLVEDLQSDFEMFVAWAKIQDEDALNPDQWTEPVIPYAGEDVKLKHKPGFLAERIRAGLDRLRAEL